MTLTPDRWQLTAEQEQFLAEFFQLCDRYSPYGVSCSSIGSEETKEQKYYRVIAEIRLRRSDGTKKPPC